jgi:hypothetical protein
MSRLCVAISLFALCFGGGRAESDAVILDAKFNAYVQQLCDVLHVPGISVAVVRRDSFESKVRSNLIASIKAFLFKLVRAMDMQDYPMLRLHQTLYGTQAARPKHSLQQLLRSSSMMKLGSLVSAGRVHCPSSYQRTLLSRTITTPPI